MFLGLAPGISETASFVGGSVVVVVVVATGSTRVRAFKESERDICFV
jgi:hypothetical protein